MYTRYPSIASIFQKAVLLKDGKCNKFIQRRLCNDSLAKLSKIDYKLKPLKRCFSGAANNRNSMQRTRNVQGVGIIRRALPKFPREMVVEPQQFLAPHQMQNSQGTVHGSAMSLNGQSSNENQGKDGTITIVIDKNEICNCSSPNEDVQIHITTLPETTQRKTSSDTDIAEAWRRKCKCCQQCEAMQNSKIQQTLPITPNMAPVQRPVPVNFMNFPNNFPKRSQSVYGLPLRNFGMSNVGEPSRMEASNLNKSRSMRNFPAMRKMLPPNRFDQKLQPQNIRQLPTMKIQSRAMYSGGPSSSGIAPPGNYVNHQPPTLQRTLIPSTMQTQRRFSFQSQPNEFSSTPKLPPPPTQHTQNYGIIFQRPNQQQPKPNPVHVLEKERNAKRMNELNRQLRKYSSFHQNVMPVPVNRSDEKQKKRPKDVTEERKETGRSGPKPDQLPQPKSIIERVLRPAMFSAKPLTGPFIRKPNSFNLEATTSRNRFPAERASAPRILASQSQGTINGGQRTLNLYRNGLNTSPGPMLNANRGIFSAKPTIHSRQQTIPSISRGNSLIPQQMLYQKQFSAPRQPIPMVVRGRFEAKPSWNRNFQIKNYQPPKMSLLRKSNVQRHPTQRHPVPRRVNLMNNFGQRKGPPQILLQRKRALRPAVNPHRQPNRQPSQTRRNSFIPTPQNTHQRNVNPKRNSPPKERPTVFPNSRNITTPTQASMIPVRNTNQSQLNLPGNNLSQQRPPTQQRNIPLPTLPPNSIRANQMPQRGNICRMNEGKFQSSLPVKQLNQIEKYATGPRSIQTVGRRPYTNPGSLRMQPMPQSRQMTPPVNGQKFMLPQQKCTNQQERLKATPGSDALNAVNSKLKSNNPAVLFYGPGKLKLVDIPVPRLTDDKGVIVKMLYVHLTDTDAQMLSAVQDGPYKLTQPTIAGKSGSGLVIDAGKQVENVKIGDKVSVKGISCGKCTACVNDNENICERVPMTEKLGILKRYHAVPAKFVTKLPDAVHLIDGAMIDELSSSIRACKKSTVTAGDNVLVVGGKSLGLWTALAAQSMGATNVCLADSNPKVLEQAKNLGIEQVFLINPDSTATNTSKSIIQYMKDESPRIVFDCSGSPLTNEIAINTSLTGGKVVLMKNSLSNRPIFLSDAVEREIDILSSQHGNNDSERAAIQFLCSGKVQLHGIDSSFYDITNVHEAFGRLTSGTNSNIFIQPSRLDDASDVKKKLKSS